MSCPRNLVGRCCRYCDVLVEARERTWEPASEPHRAEYEKALGVVDVREYFTNAPLGRGISVERALFRHSRRVVERYVQLLLEYGDDVLLPDPVDVAEVIRCGFVSFRTSDNSFTHANVLL